MPIAAELKDAAPLMHGYPWTGQPVKGWWMSEKLDGVRAYWDGAALWSRNLRPIAAPAWWLGQLPQGVALDGELWCGRGRYDHVLGAVKTSGHIAWADMMLPVFDLPAHPGVWEERQEARPAENDILRHVRHTWCTGLAHMKRELRAVHARGGEGLMLAEAGARYEAGRSHAVLKVRCVNNSELL